MTGFFKHKKTIKTCDPWDPKGMKKNVISISIAFSVDTLIRNEHIISKKHKTKDRLK